MNKNIIKNEDGSALVLVMMVLLVLSVLGVGLGMVTMGSLNLSATNQDINSAYYIAQAGANMAYEEMKVEVIKAYNNTKQSDSDDSFFYQINNTDIVKGEEESQITTYDKTHFDSTSSSQRTAEVKIVKLDYNSENSTYKYLIQSTGNVDGKTRKVEKPIEVRWKSHVLGEGIKKLWDINAALTVKESIELPRINRFSNSELNVRGKLIHDQNYKKIGPGRIDQTDYVWARGWLGIPYLKRIEHETIEQNINWEKYDTILDEFPDEPEYNNEITGSNSATVIYVNQNTYIPTVESNLFKSITIDTRGKEINILVDDLVLNGGINISVLGTGTVNFYVKNSMNINGIGSINRYRRESQLNFLYAGDDNEVVFNGAFHLNASIFVKNANIKINGASVVSDGIISGGESISVVGAHVIGGMIYAPYANVRIAGGAGIDGIVLAKNLKVDGIATIDYNGEYVDDFYYYSDSAEVEPTIEHLISSDPALEQ